MHTIILDPDNADRMAVGISAAGYFRTDDGGETWLRKMDGLALGDRPVAVAVAVAVDAEALAVYASGSTKIAGRLSAV